MDLMSAATGKTAVLTGLAAEMRALDNKGDKTKFVSVCAASDPHRARLFLGQMLAAGVNRCLSFGLAGGLAPDLPAGSIVVGSRVVSTHGRYECDSAWVRQLATALPGAHVGDIWGQETILASPGLKQAIYHGTHCLVCDMESQVVGGMAEAAGLPFVALRVVCDPADFALPPAALLPLHTDGTPNLPAILGDLWRHPRQLPALLTLAQHNRRALKALAQAAAVLC